MCGDAMSRTEGRSPKGPTPRWHIKLDIRKNGYRPQLDTPHISRKTWIEFTFEEVHAEMRQPSSLVTENEEAERLVPRNQEQG